MGSWKLALGWFGYTAKGVWPHPKGETKAGKAREMREATQGLEIIFLGYSPSLCIILFHNFIIKILKPFMLHKRVLL